ncbi:class I tRNA ligase family protein, partial [Candidatus Woesearchaeota archaeon]|nr:class I tRNA ligase family protein [Candidatus Woesearchaeota archaeon]
ANSGDFNGMNNREAMEDIADLAEKKKWGKRAVNYKLKDWLVSRQRYWGTPIPFVHCEKCGVVPVSEKDLPILLPEKVKFGKGNPLETNKKFVETECPKCKGKAKRETDTMDTFFDSSWYFLRYCDNKNDKVPFLKNKVQYWMPVDQYIGGAEHACMHLIYARFFTKALRDLGYLKFDEPFTKLFNQGMLHGNDGFVMSKSRGNVVLPETISKKYGIDTARFFLVSIASPDKDLQWSDQGIEGGSRFIKKVFNYFDTVKIGKSSSKVESKLNKAVKGITEDIENFAYNMAIIKLRELFDSLEPEVSKFTLQKFLKLLHPFCPHFTEELWEKIGGKGFISLAKWPEYDESKIDLKAEANEELVHQTLSDINSVIELTGIKEPKEVTLFISEKWKYSFFNKIKKVLAETHDMKSIMGQVVEKEHAKDIAKIVPKLIKDPSKIPSVITSQDNEYKVLMDAREMLRKELKIDKVDVVKAEDSEENKAKQASPGKPAILIK